MSESGLLIRHRSMTERRCETCARKMPCLPCSDLHMQAIADEREFATMDDIANPATIIVWSSELRYVLSVVAQWPWASEMIEPDETGDRWGVRLAKRDFNIGRDPVAEFEIEHGKLRKLADFSA